MEVADDGQGHWARREARIGCGSDLGEDGLDDECGDEPNHEEDGQRLDVSHFFGKEYERYEGLVKVYDPKRLE